MITVTAGMSFLRIRVSSSPFMSGMVRSVNQRGLQQLRFFDGLTTVFGFAAHFKVSLAREEFAKGLANYRILSSTISTDRTGTRPSSQRFIGQMVTVRCRTARQVLTGYYWISKACKERTHLSNLVEGHRITTGTREKTLEAPQKGAHSLAMALYLFFGGVLQYVGYPTIREACVKVKGQYRTEYSLSLCPSTRAASMTASGSCVQRSPPARTLTRCI
jgi:hypothetical protein